MYKCLRCGNVFDSPLERWEDVGARGAPYIEHYCICPDCGADDIETAVECHICGRYEYYDNAHIADNGDWLCETCYEKEEENNG